MPWTLLCSLPFPSILYLRNIRNETTFDYVCNCVCIVFMTPYYQNEHHRLCSGMIKCFSLCDSEPEIVQNATVKSKDGQQQHDMHDGDDTKYEYEARTLGIGDMKPSGAVRLICLLNLP